MTDMSLFNSGEFGEMRTCCDPGTGEVWFCLADVCRALDISNVSDAKNDLPDGVATTYPILDSLGREQKATFVNESGLYRIIFKSRKEKALRFQDWVYSEVLPTIRKHGAYMTPETIEQVLTNPDTVIKLATQLKNEQEARKKLQERTNVLEKKVEKDAPKVRFADAVVSSVTSMSVRDAAVILTQNGHKIGQNQFFEYLRANGFLYRKGISRNLPKQKWVKCGYFEVHKSIRYDNKAACMRTDSTPRITNKGMKHILERFDREEGNLFATVI